MPNNSFKPNLLRSTNNMAVKACHVVGSATQVGLTQALGMFRTLLQCPHCRNEIALADARTEVPVPEESTWRKKVQWVYTACPQCHRDFKVTGEKRGAVIVLGAVLSLLALSFFVDSWLPLALIAIILLLQNKVMQLLIRAEHA